MTYKIKILLLSKYSRSGASSRLRTLQYLPALINQGGFQFFTQNLFDDAYLNQLYKKGKRSKINILWLYLKRLWIFFSFYKYDLIWIEKEIFPYLPALAERLVNFLGTPYIVDYDDAVFHNYDLSSSWIIRNLLGKKIDIVMRYSNCVIVGNQYLANRAQAAGACKIVIVPTVVDHSRYDVKDQVTTNHPVIGWIGSPSTKKYLLEIRQALVKACEIYNARILLVGANPDFAGELADVDVDIQPWAEDHEAELIRNMDIGIMPLTDGPWEKGKSGYKLIQYMACGVPVVASPVGVNTDIVNSSQSGLLADSPQAWQTALLQLLASPQTRSRMGINGRCAVEEKYSLASQLPVLIDIFYAAISQNRS